MEPAGIRGPDPRGRLQRREEPNRVQIRQTSRTVDGRRARDRSQDQFPRSRSLHSDLSSNRRTSSSGGRESLRSSPEVPCYFTLGPSAWLHGSTHRRRSGTTCTPHSHAAYAVHAVEQSRYTHTRHVHFNTYRVGASENGHVPGDLLAAAAALRLSVSGVRLHSRSFRTSAPCIAPHIPSPLLRRWSSLALRALLAHPAPDDKVFDDDDRCAARCAGDSLESLASQTSFQPPGVQLTTRSSRATRASRAFELNPTSRSCRK